MSYVFILDEDKPGVWEHQLFMAFVERLNERGLETELASASSFRAKPRFWRSVEIELGHNLAILQHRWSRRYWVLDGNDWVAPFDDNLKNFSRDRRCQGILKCQFEQREFRSRPLVEKVHAWTYFETHCRDFQTWLEDLRAVPRTRSPLFFRGNVSWANRREVLERLAARNLVNEDFDTWVSYEEHARELAEHHIVLGLEGFGNVCHREIEAFGISVPILMPRHRNEMHDPLIPDVHYLAVDANVYEDDLDLVAERIEARYHQAQADPQQLATVAQNALDWYERNVRHPASLDLGGRILGLWD